MDTEVQELELRHRPQVSPNFPRVQVPEPPSTPKVIQGSGSRPKYYLLENPVQELSRLKLPKNEAVLSGFLDILGSSSGQGAIMEAAKKTRAEVKSVWKHHFGSRLIEGKELGSCSADNEKKKIIVEDKLIEKKIKETWDTWKKLEYESRRPARASSKM